jgi:hypothetical protein
MLVKTKKAPPMSAGPFFLEKMVEGTPTYRKTVSKPALLATP